MRDHVFLSYRMFKQLFKSFQEFLPKQQYFWTASNEYSVGCSFYRTNLEQKEDVLTGTKAMLLNTYFKET